MTDLGANFTDNNSDLRREAGMNVSYIAHISGRVQGVYFRASSQQQAIEYSLSGYARNLADGDVEVLLCGEQVNIDKMLAWLSHGPEQAQVDDIQHKKVPWQEHNFFSIG
ncbi:acylphosphatase [Colwellia piezophila]|uniref:acylphosphatase n=1 Tax=Colwellia piezophila TaxID=211668 RepID=UPI0003609E2A|nr:acylphosphatase [Colwellia piezophila]